MQIDARQMPGPLPNFEDDAGFQFPSGGDAAEQILVLGRRTVGGLSFDLWSKVVNTVSEFFGGSGANNDYFNQDGALVIRGKITNALSHSGLSADAMEKITKGILNKLLDSQNVSLVEALGRMQSVEFIVHNDPSLTKLGETRILGNQITINLNETLIRSYLPAPGQDGPYANNIERTFLHELLHAGGLYQHAIQDANTYPGGVTQYVADAQDPSKQLYYTADGQWVGVMQSFGQKLGLSTAGNAAYWYPIVIDANANGLDLVTKDSGVRFDVQSNGHSQQTGWIGASEWLLVADWNHTGKIEHGSEVSFSRFGNDATSDLKGLASFDSDHNGRIDAKDQIFEVLRIWQDANMNGKADAGELRSLREAGVESIELKASGDVRYVAGNIVKGETIVHLVGGATLHAYDVGFHL